jgi:hypothetical protein
MTLSLRHHLLWMMTINDVGGASCLRRLLPRLRRTVVVLLQLGPSAARFILGWAHIPLCAGIPPKVTLWAPCTLKPLAGAGRLTARGTRLSQGFPRRPRLHFQLLRWRRQVPRFLGYSQWEFHGGFHGINYHDTSAFLMMWH